MITTNTFDELHTGMSGPWSSTLLSFVRTADNAIMVFHGSEIVGLIASGDRSVIAQWLTRRAVEDG